MREADALRARALPLIAAEPDRVPAHNLSGPDLPCDDSVRRRLFGESEDQPLGSAAVTRFQLRRSSGPRHIIETGTESYRFHRTGRSAKVPKS
jgi:hypothetical protein